MQNIFDLIREDEEKTLIETRKEIAKEKAEWEAMTQEEKDAKTRAVEEKYKNVPDEEPDLDSEDYDDSDDD